MTHPSVAAYLADPRLDNTPVETYPGEPETEMISCDGCGQTAHKVLAEHAHFYPEDWRQLVVTGAGDIIGKHLCATCGDRVVKYLARMQPKR